MSLARSTLVVGFATALSRVLGFARDMLIARALGAGAVADAFFIAFRLPNLARRTLSEGALNAGFVPLYLRLKNDAGTSAASRFAADALSGFAMLLLAVVGAVEIAAGAVVLLIAGGYAGEPHTLSPATIYTRLAFPFVWGISLASLIGAILNAERRFGAAAFARSPSTSCSSRRCFSSPRRRRCRRRRRRAGLHSRSRSPASFTWPSSRSRCFARPCGSPWHGRASRPSCAGS